MDTTFTQGYALIVGVGGDLPNTVNDARGVASLLTDPTRCAYPRDHVSVLTGEQATRTSILSGLDALAGSTNVQSTVIFYFSGHGCKVATLDDDRYFLIPSDYDPNRFYQGVRPQSSLLI
jgi:Caspase domain